MIRNDVTKSKDFKDKQAKLRENLRLTNEREFIEDFARLFEEKLFCDVTFIVEGVEFPAHVCILHARAPKFSEHFLPDILTSSVQSCINIQNLQSDEFAAFLRSVYLENSFQDYSKSDYPWTEKVTWRFTDDSKSPFVQNQRHEFEDSLDECVSNAPDVNGYDDEAVAGCPATRKSFNIEAENSSTDACCKIGKDLINLVDDPKSSDVTFILNDNKKVNAHRAILCKRSSYFSAMLLSDWSEKQATDITLTGISRQAFVIVLYFLYGGITRIPLEECTDICDVLYLADMYGLEGLKEVVLCELKLVKCHLFHKPCTECITGVLECLEVSEMFHLMDLKKQCLKWAVKYFDRVYTTKSFAYTSPNIQQEIHSALQSSINKLNVIELLCREDKLDSSLPRIKWSEPVLELISVEMDYCLSFIADIFPVIVAEARFWDMMKGVGWSTPLLEKIFMRVWNSLTITNCCERLKVGMRLRNMLKVDSEEEEENAFSEEVCSLVERFYTKCQNFIVSNLHRVTHTDGWNHLSPRTQTEIRKSKGGMFVDVGLPSQRNRTFPSSSKRLSSYLRSSTKNLPPSEAGATGNLKPRPKSAGLSSSLQVVKTKKPGTISRPASAVSTSARDSRSAVSSSSKQQTSLNTNRAKSTLPPTGRGRPPVGRASASREVQRLKEPSKCKVSNAKKTETNEVSAKESSSASCSKRMTGIMGTSSKSTAASAPSTTRRMSEKPPSAVTRNNTTSNQSKLNDNKGRSANTDKSKPKLSNEKVKKTSLNSASSMTSSIGASSVSKSRTASSANSKACEAKHGASKLQQNKPGGNKMKCLPSNTTMSGNKTISNSRANLLKKNKEKRSTAGASLRNNNNQAETRQNVDPNLKSKSTADVLRAEIDKKQTLAIETTTQQSDDTINVKSEATTDVLHVENNEKQSLVVDNSTQQNEERHNVGSEETADVLHVENNEKQSLVVDKTTQQNEERHNVGSEETADVLHVENNEKQSLVVDKTTQQNEERPNVGSEETADVLHLENDKNQNLAIETTTQQNDDTPKVKSEPNDDVSHLENSETQLLAVEETMQQNDGTSNVGSEETGDVLHLENSDKHTVADEKTTQNDGTSNVGSEETGDVLHLGNNDKHTVIDEKTTQNDGTSNVESEDTGDVLHLENSDKHTVADEKTTQNDGTSNVESEDTGDVLHLENSDKHTVADEKTTQNDGTSNVESEDTGDVLHLENNDKQTVGRH